VKGESGSWVPLPEGFHRTTLCISAVFAVGRCLSVCPSVTFVFPNSPNTPISSHHHWSLLTFLYQWCILPLAVDFTQGLYPESHGIIDNLFYDLKFRERFQYIGRNHSDNRWWSGEPVVRWLITVHWTRRYCSLRSAYQNHWR